MSSSIISAFAKCFALTVAVFLGAVVAPAATLTVDDDHVQCPSAAFTSIQAAVAAASPNDKINVCPGTYHEQVVINKPLTVQGIQVGNDALSLIQPGPMVPNTTSLTSGNPSAAIILVDGASKVSLNHLTVDGTGNNLPGCGPNFFGIYFRNASGTVDDMAVRNIQLAPSLFGCQTGLGIFVQSNSSGKSKVDILDSSIHDYQKGAIVANEANTEVNVSGNQISGIGPTAQIAQNGIQIGFGAKGTVTNNSVINHIYSPCTPSGCGASSINILIFQSDGTRVFNNSTGNAQVNIYYEGNRGEVTGNTIFQTLVFEGIDLIGDRNSAVGNNVKNSGASAVYVLGNKNDVVANILNEAPIGIYQDQPGSDNHLLANDFDNIGQKIVTAPALAAATLNQTSAPGRATSPATP